MSEGKKYRLLGADGSTYLSDEPGTLGGNGKAKIYGRLDCPAALRTLNSAGRETYVKYRVFFKDEQAAIAAGFHPCGTCMRERYKAWKAAQDAGEVWKP